MSMKRTSPGSGGLHEVLCFKNIHLTDKNISNMKKDAVIALSTWPWVSTARSLRPVGTSTMFLPRPPAAVPAPPQRAQPLPPSQRGAPTALTVSTAVWQQAAASSLRGSWTGGSRGSGFLQGWQNTWLSYRTERIGKSRDDAIFCKRAHSEHANTRHPHLPATGQPWNPRPPLPEPAQWERVSSPTYVYFSAFSSTAPAPMEPKTHQPHAAFSPKAVCHL